MRKGNGDNQNSEDGEGVQDVEQLAIEIIEKSLEQGNKEPITSIEGKCIECGDIATLKSPVSGERYCEYHATKHFEQRHG